MRDQSGVFTKDNRMIGQKFFAYLELPMKFCWLDSNPTQFDYCGKQSDNHANGWYRIMPKELLEW